MPSKKLFFQRPVTLLVAVCVRALAVAHGSPLFLVAVEHSNARPSPTKNKTMADGWIKKKRARDVEAAEAAWQDWQSGCKQTKQSARGMSMKTAESHLFPERMKTILLKLDTDSRSDAVKLQDACDALRDLFVSNKEFLLSTVYVNGEEKANRLRCNGALVKVVLRRFDEFERAFDDVFQKSNVSSLQDLQVQLGCLRDALPPKSFQCSDPKPRHNERNALEQMVLFPRA